jgi:hypothetical protein
VLKAANEAEESCYLARWSSTLGPYLLTDVAVGASTIRVHFIRSMSHW